MTEDWTKWQSLVINGIFPLRRFLGRSNHSVVFLTEHKSQHSSNAAIKLVPADPKLAEAQLAQWRTVAALSHPHLIRLLDSGRCQIGGQQFIFVVMEYAEQTLAQILPHRALTADEVRELLLPTLDALAFLHRKNLVQGQLKPPNFLVVNDQLKLASDNIRPAGEPAAIAKSSLYDPSPAKDGGTSAAGDIWALGMVIVEALTQVAPARSGPGSETVSLPATLPPPFAAIVRRCLSTNPAGRPTVGELEAQIKAPHQAPVASAPRTVLRDAAATTRTPQKSPGTRSFVVGFAGSLLIFVAIWVGVRSFKAHPVVPQPALSASPDRASLQPAAPAVAVAPIPKAPAAAVAQNPKAPISAPTPVLHQEIPDVPHSARESIHGHIKVTVRVTVDRAGNVVDETLEGRGSSKYFARLATEAARKWKFVRADDQPSRVWLLQFDFTRGGAAGHALSSRS